MNFILPLIISLIGGAISSGISQHQENKRAQAEAERERAQREAQAAVAERRREQVLERTSQIERELADFAERVRRGAEYSGLEAGASREASRNVAASNAAAALAGLGDSGAAQSAAGAIMADAIGQTAMARLQDQLQREGLIGEQQAAAQQLVAQLLQDQAFNVGTADELNAGHEWLLQQPGVFGSAVAGGIGSALPIFNQWAMGQLGAANAGGPAPAPGSGGGFGVGVRSPGLSPQVPQLPLAPAGVGASGVGGGAGGSGWGTQYQFNPAFTAGAPAQRPNPAAGWVFGGVPRSGVNYYG